MLPFFEQLKTLRDREPKIAFKGMFNENCSYNDNLYFGRNCYLCFDCDKMEFCLYMDMSNDNLSCADCSFVSDCELCYECVDSWHCYNCDFCQQCRDSVNSAWSFDLLNCRECFGCVGLRHKQYCLFNEQLPQEEWKKQIAYWKKQPREKILEKIGALRKKIPTLSSWQFKTENCIGDFLLNSKNCYNCFDSQGCQDSGYLTRIYNVYGERTVDTWDCMFNVDLTSSYECIQVGKGWNCSFCHFCENVRDAMFCEGCYDSHDLFGCVNVKRKNHCILNTEYPQAEYKKRKDAILAEMKKERAFSQWFEVAKAPREEKKD